jgi:hypothetical protein
VAQNLYPLRPPDPFGTLHATHESSNPPITTQLVATALAKLKPGTTSGPLLDHTSTLTEYALHTQNAASPNPTQPHLQTMTAILCLIINNQVPPSVARNLRACWFLALHKDPGDKLRPIGIGSAYRRLASTVLVSIYNPIFASMLTQHGQMVVAVSGGINLLIRLVQANLDHHILAPIAADKHPTRAAIRLDLQNFFNKVSLLAIRRALTNHQLNALLPYFDLMYDAPNQCYFLDPDGQLDFLTQNDGIPQGDPLSVALSALVLHNFLAGYQDAQSHRAHERLAQRNPGDDGQGSIAMPHYCIDDGLYFLPYEDLPWFIAYFQDHGPQYGIHLNQSKTRILTTATDHPAHHLLPPAQRRHLQIALTRLADHTSEAHAGLAILGQPLGSPIYSTTFLQDKVTRFVTATSRLNHRLSDPQTIASLYKCCSIPALAHLLAADVLHETKLVAPPTSPRLVVIPLYRHPNQHHRHHIPVPRRS